MSEYTIVSFTLPRPYSINKVKRRVAGLWDGFQFSKRYEQGKTIHILQISELNLKESLFILDELKREFSLYFKIEDGNY